VPSHLPVLLQFNNPFSPPQSKHPSSFLADFPATLSLHHCTKITLFTFLFVPLPPMFLLTLFPTITHGLAPRTINQFQILVGVRLLQTICSFLGGIILPQDFTLCSSSCMLPMLPPYGTKVDGIHSSLLSHSYSFNFLS
jgi:hypothetical protein